MVSVRNSYSCNMMLQLQHDALWKCIWSSLGCRYRVIDCIQEVTEGKRGVQYMIADMGTLDKPKEIGVHSKRVPRFVLPDSHERHISLPSGACKDRSKMRPDMMMVEMTEFEQKLYFPHNTNNTRLPSLPAKLPNGKARQVTIVAGGYCSDVSYMEKLREKQRQHAALEEAWQTYGYEVSH